MTKKLLVGNWCKDIDNYLADNEKINTFSFNNWKNFKKKNKDVKLILKVYKKLIKKISLNLNKNSQSKLQRKILGLPFE